jgi:hypothetical protein
MPTSSQELRAVKVAGIGKGLQLGLAHRFACSLGHLAQLRAVVARVRHLVRHDQGDAGRRPPPGRCSPPGQSLWLGTSSNANRDGVGEQLEVSAQADDVGIRNVCRGFDRANFW